MKTKYFLPLTLFALTATAQTEIRPYEAGRTTEGITYFLPRTALQVVVTAKRTVYEPGEYAVYAERFLRLNDVVQEKIERWQLQSISIFLPNNIFLSLITIAVHIYITLI